MARGTRPEGVGEYSRAKSRRGREVEEEEVGDCVFVCVCEESITARSGMRNIHTEDDICHRGKQWGEKEMF